MSVKRPKIVADKSFLQMAQTERMHSDDPKALRVPQSGVGAIIVGKSGVIARSANVLPPALKFHNVSNRVEVQEADRYYFIEHAERAAIYNAMHAGESLEGATLYCTRFPCSDCARAIVWAGIARVVLSIGFAGEDKWRESQRAALRLLRLAGTSVRIIKCLDSPSAATTKSDNDHE